jgi:NADPH:quinone reductase-like Zn-dependent oxidoreductase
MKAVVIQEANKAAVTDAPEPKVKADYVKIKTEAIAINPTDWVGFHTVRSAHMSCTNLMARNT